MIELVGDVARRIARRFAPVAAGAGLSVTEGLALWKIYKRGGCKASEVAEHLGLPPSTVTGILDRLEAGGWVLREADPGDRRATIIAATRKLSDYVKSSKRAVSKGLERSFKGMPQEVLDRLCRDLGQVLVALEAEEEQPK